MSGTAVLAVDLGTGVANAMVTGLVTGSVIAMGAIGLALVYSIAEVPNFAHGELLMIGAYVAFVVNTPAEVPVLDLLTRGNQGLTTVGLAVPFVLAAGAVLVVINELGGRASFRGEWWPVDVPAGLAVAVNLVLAALVGVLVVVSTPSIWGGMLLSFVVMAAFAPQLENVVFDKFREKDVELATMLIVTLGLSFVLRYTTQAYFGGVTRQFVVPDRASVAGVVFPLSAAQFFDLYLTGGGLVFRWTDTQAGNLPTMVLATVEWSWPAAVGVVVATAVVAALAYRWRARGTEFGSGMTFGPSIVGAVAGVVTFVVLAVATAASRGSAPDAAVYATRIKLSFMRTSVVAIALVMMTLLHLLLKETKLGIAMRASSDNIDLARVTGINTDRVMSATWIIAGAYAAIGGVMLGILFAQIFPNMGFFLLLPMFAGVILGGVGSVYGAMMGSFIVGLSMEVGITVLPIGAIYRIPLAFVVLFVVLLVKPEGIVGGS